MLGFIEWLQTNNLVAGVVSLRDYVSWTSFIGLLAPSIGPFPAFAHGACLTFVDAIGTGISSMVGDPSAARRRCDIAYS